MASIFDFVDFRGGYATDIPSEQMADNEALQADDVRWDNGIKKRGGISRYASITGSDIRGGVRVQIEGVWRTVLAVEDSGAAGVTLELGTTTAFSTLTYPSATAHTLTAGTDVQFAVLGEQVVAVNGVDEPRIVWATASTVFTDTVERYDTRTEDDAFVYAGQYSSTTASGNYAANSEAAQSSTSVTFELQAPATGAGFWVANDNTFNLVEALDVEATSSATFTHEYLGRASAASSITWVAYTPIDAPTWTSAGNSVSEFEFPIDTVDGSLIFELGPDSLGDPLTNRYCWRAVNRETSLTAPLDAQGLKVQHTQFLSQLMVGDKPNTVATSASRIWLGMRNWLRWGQFGTLKKWHVEDFEFFRDGGEIQAMHRQSEGLTILMNSGIHSIFGTSVNNHTVRRNQSNVGSVGPRASVVDRNLLYFVARDGIWMWDGSRILKVSKHIQSDIDSWTLTTAAATVYEGSVYFSFPANSRILEFDPDTFRTDPTGDGRMSLFRHTGHAIDQFIYEYAQDDNGILLGLDNTNVYLLQLDNGTVDNINATATINMQFQSKYYHFDGFHTPDVFTRLRPRVGDVSVTAGDDYTFKIYTQDEYGEASSTATLTASVASGIHTQLVSVPPSQGRFYNLGFSVQHDTQYDAKFYGISIEMEEREF